MMSDILHAHVRARLKHIHLSGIVVMVCFFAMLFYLGATEPLNTLPAQMILLLMAVLIALSYVSVLSSPSEEPIVPLLMLFALNICTTLLVWATGILESPFIILYVILIIVTTQLYSYVYALLQMILAIFGFLIIYGATTYHIISYYPLFPYTDRTILFQPPTVILIYGLLYALLFAFTVLATSTARMILFRPIKKLDLDSTYQEKIIQQMPLPVLVVDGDQHILSENPAAMIRFSAKPSAPLSAYLAQTPPQIYQLLRQLIGSTDKQDVQWHKADGETVNVKMSAALVPSKNKTGNTYILFLE